MVALGLGVELVREWAHRGRLERLLAAQAPPRDPLPSRLAPLPEMVADPDSYLVLTRRLLAGMDDPPPPPELAVESSPASPKPPLSPLRIRDFDRLRDL
jgi:hypothetical protein